MAIAVAQFVFLADVSDAALTLRVAVDGGSSVEVNDGSVGDSRAEVGVIVYNGALDNFIVTVSTGIGKPLLGTSDIPQLHLGSVNLNSTTGGAITIELTETAFTGTPMGLNPAAFLTSIGGTTPGTVTIQAFAGVEGDLYQVMLSELSYEGGAFSGADASDLINLLDLNGFGGEYALTLRVRIEHDGAFQASSFDANLEALPEPSSLLVWGGIAACAVGCGIRRRRQSSG